MLSSHFKSKGQFFYTGLKKEVSETGSAINIKPSSTSRDLYKELKLSKVQVTSNRDIARLEKKCFSFPKPSKEALIMIRHILPGIWGYGDQHVTHTKKCEARDWLEWHAPAGGSELRQ